MNELDFRLLCTQLNHLDIVGAFSLNHHSGSRFHYITYLYNNLEFCVRIEEHLFEFESLQDRVIILQNIILDDMTTIHYLLFNDSTFKEEINYDYQALCSKIHEAINFMEVFNGIHIEYRVSFDVIEDFISKMFFENIDWLEIYQTSLIHFNVDFALFDKPSISSLIANNP